MTTDINNDGGGQEQEIPAENTVKFTIEGNDDVAVPAIVIPEVEVISTQEHEVKIENNPEPEKVIEAAPEDEEDDDDYVELDDTLAFEHLRKSKGFEFKDIDELLTPKEQKKYAPELEKYQEFIDKTGNTNFNDFQATQKDWNAETQDNILREYIKAKNPDLSKEDIDFLYDEKYNIEDLDEEDDEREIRRRGILSKTDLREASEFLEKRKQEYMAERGSDAHIPEEYREAKTLIEKFEQQQEATDLAREANSQDYVSKVTDYFTKDYDGIKVKLGNDEMGYEEVSFKPENINETIERHTDISKFNRKFFDEQGKLVKPKEWNEAIYMAENWQTELNKAYNRGIAKKLEIDDKLSKNIQPDNLRNVSENRSSGITFTIEK